MKLSNTFFTRSTRLHANFQFCQGYGTAGIIYVCNYNQVTVTQRLSLLCASLTSPLSFLSLSHTTTGQHMHAVIKKSSFPCMRLHSSALSHITSAPHMHASHMCADKHLLIAGKTVPTQWTCTCVVSRWSNNAQITTQVNGLDNGYRVARPRLQLPVLENGFFVA